MILFLKSCLSASEPDTIMKMVDTIAGAIRPSSISNGLMLSGKKIAGIQNIQVKIYARAKNRTGLYLYFQVLYSVVFIRPPPYRSYQSNRK